MEVLEPFFFLCGHNLLLQPQASSIYTFAVEDFKRFMDEMCRDAIFAARSLKDAN